MAIYFEEVLYHERKQMREQGGGGSYGYETEIVGSPEEINLFEDEAEMERLAHLTNP